MGEARGGQRQVLECWTANDKNKKAAIKKASENSQLLPTAHQSQPGSALSHTMQAERSTATILDNIHTLPWHRKQAQKYAANAAEENVLSQLRALYEYTDYQSETHLLDKTLYFLVSFKI